MKRWFHAFQGAMALALTMVVAACPAGASLPVAIPTPTPGGAPASADSSRLGGPDRILDDDVALNVASDGVMDVRERLSFWVAGDDLIRRGITRAIPTIRYDRQGASFGADLKMISVKRDGRDEPWASKAGDRGIVVFRIGNPNVMLDRGEHVYELHYRVKRQVTAFEDHDELFWNATGNYWDFSIDHARVTVTLPQGADISRAAVWTGAVGSRASHATGTKLDENSWSFETSQPLAPHQGMSFALAFKPDIVVNRENILARLGPSGLAWVLALVGVSVAGGFWFVYGRDPRPGVIIPLFHAPRGLSASGARQMGLDLFDARSVGATVISLATKKKLTVKGDRDSGYELGATSSDDGAELSADEADFLRELKFPIRLGGDTEPDQSLYDGYLALKGRAELLADAYTARNWGLRSILGAGWLGLTSVMLWAGARGGSDWIGLAVSAVVGVVLAFVVLIAARRLRQRLFGTDGLFAKGLAVIGLFIAVGLVVIVGGAGYLLLISGGFTPGLYLSGHGALVAAGVFVGWAVWYMDRKSRAGRALMDQVLGLREYIAMAERDRMNLSNPPDRTPEHFAELLPFALALGVEQKWAEGFADLFKVWQESSTPTFDWYEGLVYGTAAGSLFQNIASDVAMSVDSSVAASMAEAVRSSGGGGFSSGGGGFSGGGGGGGGGSGW